MKKMNLLKISIFVIIFLIGLFGLLVFYAVKIEPYQLKVKEYISVKNKDSDTEVRIVQFSDVHIKEEFTFKNLSKVVEKINQQNPDFVVFTGDLYDNYSIYHDDQNIINELSKIKANYGKIAIWGNRDYGGGAGQHYTRIVQEAGFMLLSNQTEIYTTNNDKSIAFTGIDDMLLGNPSTELGQEKITADYSVFLTHEPDYVKNYSVEDYDIILSGHSHGGQINIPFIPSINETGLSFHSHSKDYRSGFYDLEKEDDRKIYVNSGIGTTHISARFGVTPEITLFRIGI
ncbi:MULTISPECIES: metallophosphoesterase [Vagococcus]|uniref:Probably a phosphohydrolase, evidenced by COGnitor n=1 Tax=Vagococcus fluvialis bH819 TaxID=1255619 RepID=A0A1X6WPH8_9ENTE|nr:MULTISPECIES: metallophosphoesterase [Vagococcus]SLM86168.1 probably a phosphohydrolase, evidenced by COGnitor [Vagococcus fluvialis bH819]